MHQLWKIVLSAALLTLPLTMYAQQDSLARKDRLQRHVYTLANDDMKGREAGSEDAARAREYIIREFGEAGIEPYFKSGWTSGFKSNGGKYTNVAGIIKGNALADEYIVVGAHYDHLGVRSDGVIYNGADDNASGTAAIMELAKELSSRKDNLKRSVIIVAFDAEEKGLYGSKAMCRIMKEKGDLSKVRLMMSIDMVGWYGTSGFLKLEGTGTIYSGSDIVQELANADNINLKLKKFETSVLTATDTEEFAKSGIPTLAVSTGLRSPYHKPQDDPELIDYDGLDKVTSYLADLTLFAATDTDFRTSGRLAEKHMAEPKTFELGLGAGYGYMGMKFKKAGLSADMGYSASAMVSGQLNFGIMGIRAEAIYSKQRCILPDAADVYNSNITFNQSAVTVPLMLVCQTRGATRAYAGFGPYYSRIMDWSCDREAGSEISPDNYGLEFAFGFKLGSVLISSEHRWQLNNYFSNPDMPARSNSTEVSISYVF